jgi:hypothetical protein
MNTSSTNLSHLFEGLPGGGFHVSEASATRPEALYPTVYLNRG